MDLAERLCEFVNAIPDLSVPCKLGYLGANESFVMFPLPGSKIVTEYMDGVKEQVVNYEFAMKSLSQSKIHDALWAVQTELETMEELFSNDGSFEFESISVTSKPFISQLDEQGWFVFLLDVQVSVIVFN